MNTNRLSYQMQNALIKQMTKEAHASQIFLSYGCWADVKGYGGIANFLYRHSQEERNHMIKFMRYILDRGGEAKVEAIPAPPENPQSLTDCFNKVFQHEVDNTTAIYDIVNLSFEEKDWATWNFMQWFVKEQIEEEKLALELIDKLKIAGGDSATDESLFTLDKALEAAADEVSLPQEATAENPS
ncbi:ferritin [Epilithonimonas zeae]|uniref:Ferritin n=1 Tax=Epilithonimonas zeae TaxID=1416779 RepID=A0A1N6JI76_9FLAO|nr:ferritin [Epilithonimonas zeae]SIO43980.1 ferritin [Epilithonimonas zeae]